MKNKRVLRLFVLFNSWLILSQNLSFFSKMLPDKNTLTKFYFYSFIYFHLRVPFKLSINCSNYNNNNTNSSNNE